MLTAVVCVLVHTAAAFAMLLLLKNGLDTNEDLHARCQYIVQNHVSWTIGWLSWNMCALVILAFFVAFARAHVRPSSVILNIVLCIASVAVANDLAAEAIEMGLIPQFAQVYLNSGISASFLSFHRIVVLLSGFVANSMYTLAVLLCVLATRKFYACWIAVTGFAVVVCGTAISVSCMLGSVKGMFWSNAFIVPLLALWQLGVAYDALKRWKTVDS